MIKVLSGASGNDPVLYKVKSGFDYSKKLGRREWVRARLETGANGVLTAVKYSDGGSGILTSMVASSGLVQFDENQEIIAAGDSIDFLPFNEVTL